MTAQSASTVADQLMSYLRTSGSAFFSLDNLSATDYGILDTSPCTNVWMVTPPSFTSDILAMDDPAPRKVYYTLTMRCFTRETGNSVESLEHAWKAQADLQSVIEGQNTLSGSVQMCQLKRGGGWDGETFAATPAGTVYIPQNFFIEIFTL